MSINVDLNSINKITEELALLRLMKPMLVRGYRFEYIINARVFISSENLEVLIDVPLEETSSCLCCIA